MTKLTRNSNDENNFPHKLLSNAKVSRRHKAFANNSSAGIKLLKTPLSKMVQSGEFATFNLMDPLDITYPTPKLTK